MRRRTRRERKREKKTIHEKKYEKENEREPNIGMFRGIEFDMAAELVTANGKRILTRRHNGDMMNYTIHKRDDCAWNPHHEPYKATQNTTTLTHNWHSA